MNLTITYEEFICIFQSELLQRFSKEEELILGTFVNVYNYRNYINKRWYTFQVFADNIEQLLQKWLSQIYNYNFRYSREDPLKSIYNLISLEDLNIFITTMFALKYCDVFVEVIIASKLIDIIKRISNLSFNEIIGYFQDHYRDHYVSIDTFSEFEGIILEKSNNRISELWWMWKDFDGKYNNYIEWLPRETLDDLLTIQHGGIIQPDYTTYIEDYTTYIET